MNLDINSWHFKIYKKWLQLKTGYSKETDIDIMLRRVKFTRVHNLCLYMRVALFWGPLKIYIHSITALLITFILFVSGLIYLELYLYGSPFFVQFSTILAAIITACIIAGGIIVGIIVGAEWLKEKYAERCAGKEVKERKPSIIWMYIKAKKQKICPVLSFNKEN